MRFGEPRVVIVAEHASAKFGGEAALPLNYFRILRQRNVPAWLLTHERTRAELEALFPHDLDRIAFVPDTAAHRLLWRLGRRLPARLSACTTGYAMRVMTQLGQRRLLRRLVRQHGVTVIHQPMPVSPKEPSLLYGMGVPVVIGPMNGGMDYPPAFRGMQRPMERLLVPLARRLASVMNRVVPGKRHAALLLVANERTRQALPAGLTGQVAVLVENGVDLALWRPGVPVRGAAHAETVHYVYVGRLVDWKAVDLLLEAFKRASARAPMRLSIIGDGTERPRLEALAVRLGLPQGSQAACVEFRGWLAQAQCVEALRGCDALVLPSLLECGGAVVLEAMAMEIPVIATAWGGPADYVDASCGILVEPTSREALIENLAAAFVRLATSPGERRAMGRAGKAKVTGQFDWEAKVDRMLAIYRDVVSRYA
jgi:glycosyltransferase involved in cell wall biosynthesis